MFKLLVRLDAILNTMKRMLQGDEQSGPFWQIYGLYNIQDLKFDGIYWGVMPRQLPTALALFFVVAFGSSLDVAAIQQDSPDPLDYNQELVTVGERDFITPLPPAPHACYTEQSNDAQTSQKTPHLQACLQSNNLAVSGQFGVHASYLLPKRTSLHHNTPSCEQGYGVS